MITTLAIIIAFLGGAILMLYLLLKLLKRKTEEKKPKGFWGQLFCRHDYCLDDPDEIFPEPPEGGWISFTRWHTCSKCGKKELLGSGLIG